MMVMIALNDLVMEKIKAVALSSCILTLGFTVTTAVFVNNNQSKSQVSGDSYRGSYFVNPEDAFKPYGKSREGIITFRGNPTRNYYGVGPIPKKVPQIRWVYPQKGTMCSVSYLRDKGDLWCGMGWTGQPTVFVDKKKLLIAYGAFDKRIHLMDAILGKDITTPLQTGDIIKGSATVDPDGYPLLYIGSRDNFLRIVSFEDYKLKEVWKLNAYSVKPVLWDDDWDASPLVLKDFLITGGENGHLHVIKLNRNIMPNGRLSVKPKMVFNTMGWDQQLLSDFPKPAVSIENSVAVYKNTVYFANSAGLLQGWDLSPILDEKPPVRVFRLWLGDDIDASITIDSGGHLYVAAEYEIGSTRSKEVGQLMKIDPKIEGDKAILWRKHIRSVLPDGIWSTPALTQSLLVATTNSGKVFGIDPRSGKQLWKLNYGNQQLWSSPVVINNRLLIATCNGRLDAYELAPPSTPSLLWSLKVSNGCFEATPAIYAGKIFIGSRDGKLYGIW